ncbi:hypothetical protein [Allostreptomyces psammosilenae]|uniref:Prenyltransferase n=1 Tax=Allostreptomyces psammosilenae TaxID=1892865 RepID=A0A853ABC6_9ACTN|nr:hypothetical protein [Allostreptomyces psammosilenae]NYI07672.1 hypothetical protein [Allostreptomyces psammosilenae]
MTTDLSATAAFMATHARLLDRRRFDLLTGRAHPDDVVSALAAYRNPDGGFGWSLEPDLRAPVSQPGHALHAFEALEDIGPDLPPAARRLAAGLCDWLASVTLPDGGLPFALPVPDADTAGCAPLWLKEDPRVSSLHLTAVVAALAHRVARHDPGVREHPWLARATEYCRSRIAELEAPRHALEYRYALWFLDAAHDVLPGAPAELARLAAWLPADAVLPVEGGADGEAMRPLDFSPQPHRPLRALLAPDAVEADLTRLAAERQADGGWIVDWHSHSEAAALEWRGWSTVRALTILRAHGMV